MANAVMNKAEAMVQISSNSRKLAENRKTLETSSAKLNYIQNKFGTNEERMPSDVRAEVYKLKSTMKTISEQNRQLCDSNAYYQKQDAAGNAQLQMALGTISLVLAPYAGLALAGGGTMAGMTGAALGANAGIGLAIGGFDYNEAYTGKNPAKDFLGENTYEDVRTISNLVSGETLIAGVSGVQAIEDARRADEIGNISQNANMPNSHIDEAGSKSAKGLIGHDFEDYLSQTIGGEGSFSVGGRDFDGGIGKRWWEAKSGNYWNMLEENPNKLAKFKSDMGDRLRIATENGATYEIFSNTPIPESIKQWLTKKGITFTELLD